MPSQDLLIGILTRIERTKPILCLRLLLSAELLRHDFDVPYDGPCSVLRTILRQYSQAFVTSWAPCTCINFDIARSFELLLVFS